MISIEEVCKRISNNISNELSLDNEKMAVINYGIFAFVHMAISVLIVGLLGLIFNVMIEALIILLTISILRQQSGGVHASSPEVCTLIGTILSVGMAVLIKSSFLEVKFIIIIGLLVFGWGYYIIYKYVPVDSISKPIKTEAKRKRLKKSSILILSLYLIIVIGNIIGYCVTKNVDLLMYSGCMYIGLLWQVFSLTKIGHIVLSKLDALFK